MPKQVRFNPDVYPWLSQHDEATDGEQIRSVVTWTPMSQRRYYTPVRFVIEFFRKVEGQRKKITIRVEETDDELVVLLCHLEAA